MVVGKQAINRVSKSLPWVGGVDSGNGSFSEAEKGLGPPERDKGGLVVIITSAVTSVQTGSSKSLPKGRSSAKLERINRGKQQRNSVES